LFFGGFFGIIEQTMSIYIRLNQEINPQQLLQKIQNEINEHRKSNSIEGSILCIEIKPSVHTIEILAREKSSAYLEEK